MPTKREDEIWRQVERQLGKRLPKGVHDYLCERYEVEFGYWEPEQAVEELLDEYRRLQKHGLDAASRPAKASIEIPDGARWQLLYDLGRAFEEKFAGQPLTEEFHGFVPMTLEHEEDNRSYPPSQRIKVEFDSGMNLATVMALLQREFRQRFRPKGWVHTTRPLGERAVALVRFVCLESEEGLTWRARLPRWNERYPQWAFPDARRLQAAFRRAERQLTGIPGSLAALYLSNEEYARRDQRWRAREIARIERYYAALEAFPNAKRSDLEVALAEHPDAEMDEIAALLEEIETERRELEELWKEQP